MCSGFKLQHVSEPLGVMLKWMAGPNPRSSDLVGLCSDERIFLSNKLSGAAVASSGTIHREPLL